MSSQKLKLKLKTTKLGILQKLKLEFKNKLESLPKKLLDLNSLVLTENLKNKNYLGNDLLISDIRKQRPSILIQMEDQTIFFDGSNFDCNIQQDRSFLDDLKSVFLKHKK